MKEKKIRFKVGRKLKVDGTKLVAYRLPETMVAQIEKVAVSKKLNATETVKQMLQFAIDNLQGGRK